MRRFIYVMLLTAGIALAHPAVAFAAEYDEEFIYNKVEDPEDPEGEYLEGQDEEGENLEDSDEEGENLEDSDEEGENLEDSDEEGENLEGQDEEGENLEEEEGQESYNYFYDFYEIEDQLNLLNDQISLLNDYSGVNTSIPQLYLDYMRDCLVWKKYGAHYVAYTSSYTLYNNTYNYYVLAFGDLSFNGSVFSGTDMHVYEFFPQVTQYSGYSNYRYSSQSNYSFNPNGFICFTDLSDHYPNIIGLETFNIRMILVFLILIALFYTFTKFGWGNMRIRRYPKYRNY